MTDVVGIRFVAEGEREATQAMRRYTAQKEKLTRSVMDGASRVENITRAWERANRMYRENTLGAEGLRAAQTQLARELAVVQGYLTSAGRINTQKARSELQAASAAREHARATEEQQRATARAKQAYEQLRASIDPLFAAQQRLAQAERTLKQAVDAKVISQNQSNRMMALYRQRMQEAGQATVTTATMTGRLRTQFLATANTIAILDGPLGGIASRFSAFGVLLGRTGLLLAGVAVSMTALFAVAGRGVRAFAQFEVETAKINAALETTRHAAGQTAESIERMAARIALSTLESEQAMRQAATRLLTFRDIAGDVFEQVLRSAADMAAAGFGTVESEATRLAKALEDPAQALTSLSRAGIVFTRQQRAMIISLIESGDRLGAMERILDNVNRRVGGAAEAAARDTMAGALDTIGQATGRAVREFGSFIARATGLRRALEGLADTVSGYAEGPVDALTAAREELGRLQENIAEINRQRADPAIRSLIDEFDDLDSRLLSLNATERERRQQLLGLVGGTADFAASTANLTALLQDQAREQRNVNRLEAEGRVAQQRGMVDRRREGIANLSAEIDMRARLVGLTEDQQRAQRAFAGEGLLGVDVDARVQEFARALADAGESHRVIRDLTREHRGELEGLVALMEQYELSLRQAREVSAAQREADSIMDQNTQLEAQIGLMLTGVEAAEARRRVEVEATQAMLRQAAATEGLSQEQAQALRNAAIFLEVNERIREKIEEITEAQRTLDALSGRLDDILEQNEVLEMQLQLMDDGLEYTKAIALAEVAVEKARINTRIQTEGITEELAQQLAYLNAMSDAIKINVELRDRVSARRPSRGGGGGRQQEAPTLAGINAELLREQEIRTELLNLTERERAVRETYYDLIRRLGDESSKYTEEQVMNVAREIEARSRLNDEMERYHEAQRQTASTITDLFMAAARGADQLRQALQNLLQQMARLFLNRAFMQFIQDGGLGNAGRFLLPALGGAAGIPARAAQGAVLHQGNIVPFARGGVVNRPTGFPMRGGTGLMGEAGPEAIMPLRRGRDGKLGVAASGEGQSGGNTYVNIANYTQAPVRETRRRTPRGDEFIDLVFGEGIPTGRADKQMQSRFGLTPMKVKR